MHLHKVSLRCGHFFSLFTYSFSLLAGVDFVTTTTNVPVLEEPVVTICATLEVIDDDLLEDNELLQLLVSAGGLQYRAIITILDTLDSE